MNTKEFWLGKLDSHALPHEWFTILGSISFILMGLTVIAALTYTKRWKWIWNEWLTSCCTVTPM